ncbi:hypothetical protein D1007_15013 [Hordeum vulgare]|nr:hypothetical protein D1007_15013 [Hordeum vulgare]
MAYLVRTIQAMEKNISEVLKNQKSLERIVDTKFHALDIKVSELTTKVNQLKQKGYDNLWDLQGPFGFDFGDRRA